jgi:2-polyprenyl-6-methoxyphenol hydroxylase-like FAD-dependent oxidoreductase
MNNKTVLILGAGIGGPTLAFWLKAAGFEPTLIEPRRRCALVALSSIFGVSVATSLSAWGWRMTCLRRILISVTPMLSISSDALWNQQPKEF